MIWYDMIWNEMICYDDDDDDDDEEEEEEEDEEEEEEEENKHFFGFADEIPFPFPVSWEHSFSLWHQKKKPKKRFPGSLNDDSGRQFLITGLVEKCPCLNPGPPTIEPTSSEDHQPNGNAGRGKTQRKQQTWWWPLKIQERVSELSLSWKESSNKFVGKNNMNNFDSILSTLILTEITNVKARWKLQPRPIHSEIYCSRWDFCDGPKKSWAMLFGWDRCPWREALLGIPLPVCICDMI